MRTGNGILVGFGLQTINVESLWAILRSPPPEHVDRKFRLLIEARVVTKADLIIGLLRESRKSNIDLTERIGERKRSGLTHPSLALLRVLPVMESQRLAAVLNLTMDASNTECFVCETPTMSHPAFVKCLRVSAVAQRVFPTIDLPSGIALRRLYHEVRDGSDVAHPVLLSRLASHLSRKPAGTTSDWNDPDCRFAGRYWTFGARREVSVYDHNSEFDQIESEGPVS